jgi:hypothetical protein
LNPTEGLVQVSRDDARVKTDALTSLTSDPPIDNCINASQGFRLNVFSWEFHGPCVVIVASDGCFGYLPTPAHFEFELLDALCSSTTPLEWEHRLHDRLASVARDDATLAAAMLGAESFSAAQHAFQARYSRVAVEFVQPYSEQHELTLVAERHLSDAKEHRDLLVKVRSDCARTLWERYRAGYEHLLSEQVEGQESAG